MGLKIDVYYQFSQAKDVHMQPFGSGPQVFRLPLLAAITRQAFQMVHDSVQPRLNGIWANDGDTNAMVNANNITTTIA